MCAYATFYHKSVHKCSGQMVFVHREASQNKYLDSHVFNSTPAHVFELALVQTTYRPRYHVEIVVQQSNGYHINVTGFEKTLLVGFFVKIEFDASLISSTIELTHLQVLD